MPGEATNLLLDNVILDPANKPDDNYYYAIDVRLQACNRYEVSNLVDAANGGRGGITAEGEALLRQIAGSTGPVTPTHTLVVTDDWGNIGAIIGYNWYQLIVTLDGGGDVAANPYTSYVVTCNGNPVFPANAYVDADGKLYVNWEGVRAEFSIPIYEEIPIEVTATYNHGGINVTSMPTEIIRLCAGMGTPELALSATTEYWEFTGSYYTSPLNPLTAIYYPDGIGAGLGSVVTGHPDTVYTVQYLAYGTSWQLAHPLLLTVDNDGVLRFMNNVWNHDGIERDENGNLKYECHIRVMANYNGVTSDWVYITIW